jgi:Type IV secretion system pilin
VSRDELPEGARGARTKGGGPFRARLASRPKHLARGTPRNRTMRLALVIAADTGMDRIVSILDSLRNALVAVLVTLSVVALTYAGVRYVIAGGDGTGVEKAKGAAKSAVMGLTLALLAPVIVAIVKRIIGG